MIKPVVVVVAHPDDEVLGCGGTIALMGRVGRPVHVLITADGLSSRGKNGITNANEDFLKQRNDAATKACQLMGCESVELLDLPDNRLDSIDLLDIVKIVESFIQKFKPETVLTHHNGDVNIDHRIIHDAVIAACRPQPGFCVNELLFFEVPSSTEWRPPGSGIAFSPNWFVDISETLDIKLAALQQYKDELRDFPHPRSLEAVESLARWRGASVGVNAAEAFVLGRKLL